MSIESEIIADVKQWDRLQLDKFTRETTYDPHTFGTIITTVRTDSSNLLGLCEICTSMYSFAERKYAAELLIKRTASDVRNCMVRHGVVLENHGFSSHKNTVEYTARILEIQRSKIDTIKELTYKTAALFHIDIPSCAGKLQNEVLSVQEEVAQNIFLLRALLSDTLEFVDGIAYIAPVLFW